MLLMLACACCIIFLPNTMAFASTSHAVEIEMDGHGTHEYPYLIGDKENLDNLRKVINSGNTLEGVWFALTNDIDLQGESIEPIVDQEKGRSFQGGFDGRGYCISNFVIDEGDKGSSFFGRIDGVVENLKLDGDIEGSICSSFAQDGYGTIMNCISESKLNADEEAAGIVNHWNGTLQNILFQGEIDAPSMSGIVESGNGNATQVYSKTYEVGNIDIMENCGTFWDDNVSDIVQMLNTYALQLFFVSEHARWLNQWKIGEKIEFSDDVVAFEGNGTEENPFIIDSADKLKVLVSFINVGCTFNNLYLYQTQDIDLKDYSWVELLDDSVVFQGIYDGNGHTICNLNTEGKSGGLFKNFNGKILNLKLDNCQTNLGCGFAENFGDKSQILNCYYNGIISDTETLYNLQRDGRLVNCYIPGVIENTEDELNNGLENLVVNYGIHCGELYTWKFTDYGIQFEKKYKDIYLEKERMYWKGNGVEKDPYLISSLEDLVYLREIVYYNESFWRYWFKQTDDIDFSKVHNWKSIADVTASNSFYGNYDGDGFKMQNFHVTNTGPTPNGTIFGNVRGEIYNVHVINCQINGIGNGVLAYNVLNTGKIFNNIIEISKESSVNSSLAIVYINSGRVLNNIVVRPNTSSGVEISLANTNIDDDSQNAGEADNNQIVISIDENVVGQFNEGILSTALHIKQRIMNFNLLSSNEKESYTLQNDISLMSVVGINFIKGILKNNILLLAAVIWTIGVGGLVIFKFIKNLLGKTKVSSRSLIQFLVLIGIYYLFLFSIHYLKPDALNTSLSFGVNIILACIFCGSVIGVVKRQGIWKKEDKYNLLNLKRHIPIIVVLTITTIVVVIHINTPVAYDADLYYGSFQQAIHNFSFSVTGILDSFCIASKPMHGIALLMTIGEALDPGTGRGVYVCNLVLLLIAQVCVYQIVGKLFSNLPKGIDAALSLCFAFSGYVIAGATYINPDFYSVITFTIFLWCVVFEYKIFACFSGFLVVCSKPNMIVAYLAFGVVYFLYECVSKKIYISKWLVYTLPASVYLILYFGVDSLNRAGVAGESKNEFVYMFGSRMLQYFAYGFIWIQEIFIISMLIILIKNKRFNIWKNKKNVFLFATWMACISQLLITIVGGSTLQLCPRYLTICAIKNIFLFALALEVLTLKKKQIYLIVTIFCGLLFVQLFKTIDPVIIATTDVKYDNLHYLVFPKKDQTGNDLTFYNYEYCRDARIGNKILSSLSKEEINNLYSDSRTGYKMAIGCSNIYAAYWDTARQCRTYIPNDNCVRLKMNSIVDGMDVKEEYMLDTYTIILRKSRDYALKPIFDARKDRNDIESFSVYYSSQRR